MKKLLILPAILLTCLLTTASIHAQTKMNWNEKQLLEPADLAEAIATKKEIPVIISIGPGATIPSSIAIGMVNTQEGLDKLKTELKGIDKNKKVVVYCGCCPFEHCPNIRPAIDVLKELNFTNYYLLNLPHNIKKDWIDKGYPVGK